MPIPFHIALASGRLVIDGNFHVALPPNASERLTAAVERFENQLSRRTGIPLLDQASSSSPTLVILRSAPGPLISALNEDEAHTIDVSSRTAQLSAGTDVGVIRGLETLLQLVEEDEAAFSIPAIHIDDHPRFAWRGLLIDVTSHWMPVDVIERNLDAMAAVKLNVFHWHLSDDQGFRVESKHFPKLHQLGSDGQYYTQDQIRSVIAYAHARGIRILPEFDMPGHCASWLVGYPELASAPGPYSVIHSFGVYDPALDPTRDEVYDFIDALLDEMTALFPDEYFHIGGDEVNGKQWHSNPRIQQFILQKQLKDEHGLQAYFNNRLEALVRKHGKKMIGWDEILHPNLPSDIMIHSWRDQESLAAAAASGHPAILSFGYYLDHLDHAGYHYSIDPQGGAAAQLTATAKNRILGGESCMWTEYVSTETVDSRIWPKAAAIAERLWSPAKVQDPADLYRRLDVVSRRLSWNGVQHLGAYSGMLERLSGNEPAASLRILADLVEPLGIDGREKAKRYLQSTPLNRLVDTARAESTTVYHLEERIKNLESSRGAADWTQVKDTLLAWRKNDAELAALLRRHFLLAEVAPISENLSRVAGIGLQALHFIESGHPASSDWVEEQTESLRVLEQPHAEVILAAVRPVRMLVDAASRQQSVDK